VTACTLTQARLKELLSYDPKTGIFTRLVRTSNYCRDDGVFGSPAKNGYLYGSLDGRKYLCHRLAWFYMTGWWPAKVDHRDTIRAHNWFENLRDTTTAINSQNRRNPSKCTRTGFLGVFEVGGRFKAKIGLNRKSIYLGTFGTPEAAYDAYLAAKRELHPGNTL